MQQQSVPLYPRGLRVFSAFLLSYLLIVMPFAQIAAGARRVPNVTDRESQKQESAEKSDNKATTENVFLNAPVPKPAPAPPVAAVITATKDDGVAFATPVAPGGTINYTLTVNNSGTTAATNVQFSDTIDSHTTLVAGSPIAATSDSYNTIGNVQLTIPDGATDLLGNDFDPDTGNNTGMTVTAETKSSTNCTGGCSNNVTISANGSFTYDPPIGFSGNDTFTYTAISGASSVTATVTIAVANEIWFIKNSGAAGGACSSNCDGRLSHPFPTLAAFNAANLGGAGQPGDNDWIFVFESTTDYTGPATLRLGQKFIGQDATASLITLTGFTQPSGTDPLPVMNATPVTIVNISATNANGITLNSGNMLRGFTVGNVGTGTKISGNGFGTLIVGNSGSPDVTLNGTGQALSLTTGTLSVTGGFVSVTSTSSAAQGISLAGVADSDGVGGGSFSFGSTTISNSGTQGILVGTTTADLNFGNTAIGTGVAGSGGTNAVSLQNNSNGTRTFGTLTIQNINGPANSAFVSGAGGGNVVAGTTNISGVAGTGNGIDIQNLAGGTSATFGATTVTKASPGSLVNLNLNSGNVSFLSLGGTNTNGAGLTGTENSGSITVTNNTGSLTTTTGPAVSITKAGAPATPITLNFTALSSTNSGTQGVNLDRVAGNMVVTTSTVTNSTGTGIQVQNTSAGGTMNFGNTSVTNTGNANVDAAGMGVFLNANAGNVTFGDLDILPDANERAFQATAMTGTITSTSGDLAATGNVTLDIVGPAGRTPLAMVLNNLDSTNSNGVGVNLNLVSGNFTVNDATLATSVQNSTGVGIQVQNTGAGGTMSFGNTNVTGSGGTGVVLGTAANGNAGAVTFADLDIAPDSGQRSFIATQDTGNITITSGTLTTTNNIGVEIIGVSSATRTPLNIQFTTVSVTGGAVAAMGIVLQNTSTTGAPGGFNVVGNGGTCTFTTPTCSGGRITNTSGADNNTSAGIGVKLTDVNSVSLTRMRIDTHPNFAIRGHGVNGFTLQNVVIDGNNGTSGTADTDIVNGEDSVRIINLTGSALIDSSYIGGGFEQNLRVVNDTGTLNRLTVSNSKIGDLDDGGAGRGVDNTNGDDDVNIEARTAGTVVNVTFTGNTLNNARGDVIQTNGFLGTTMDVVFRGNFVSNNHPNKVVAGGGATFQSTGNKTYDISCNLFRDSNGIGLNVFKLRPANGTTGGTFSGTIFNNRVGVTGVQNSGAADGASGINVEAQGNGVHTTLIKNNIVRNTGEAGIRTNVIDANTSAPVAVTMNATVIGNTVAEPDLVNSFAGFYALQGAVPGADANTTLNLKLGNAAVAAEKNSLNDGQAITNDVFLQRATGPPPIGVFNLSRAGSASPTATQVVQDDNTVDNPSVFTDTGITLVAGNPTLPAAINEACTPPSTPPVAMFTVPAERRFETARVDGAVQVTPVVTEAPKANTAPVEAKPLFARAMETLTAFANATRAVPTAHANAGLTEVTKVAQENLNQQTDARSNHALSANAGSNEVHATEKPAVANHIMNRALAPVSGETVSGTIGTLAAGATTTIKFSVTVNDPPNLTLLGPPRVENQAAITADGPISVLSDDTDQPGGATDKTRTLIDLFNTTTTLGSNLNPSNVGDQVTFTATVAESPTQASADPTGTVNFIDTSNGNAVVCGNVALAAGSAQCQTSALTAGTHNIRADYSGDANFDSSQSNIVAQVVIACTPNPIVTSPADSGAGSLRDAIANVCTGNTITFDLPGAGPHTITLTTGELALTKNVVIKNNSGEIITISGNNASRVFNVNSGKTAGIIGLTISGGNAANGGGILNDGILTVVNSTLTGNAATSDGAGIQLTATATSMTLINTTISGNLANGFGGGVDVLGGTATIINTTITNNHGDNDNGGGGGAGGLRRQGGTATLLNTIVAGNFAGSGTTTRNDIEGAVDALSTNNLIGDGTNMTGITNGSGGNQVGTSGSPIDPQIGALANNGGVTQTHALLGTSTAIEAGNNANLPTDTFDLDGDADTGESLPVDQRGLGFPRTADSADANTTQTVDIGAFELHPSIEDIADQSTNEDTVKNVMFNLGDDTGSLISTVTATSSNTTLVPNNIANLSFTGSGGSRTLQITPATNQSGTTTITVTVTATNGRTATDSFVLTVNGVNDAPTANSITPPAFNEDTQSVITLSYSDPEGDLATTCAISSPTNVTVTQACACDGGGVCTVGVTGTANYNGAASFTYTVNAGGQDSNSATATLTIDPVNDPPSFTIAGNPPAVAQDAGPQTVLNFATSISAGPGESQTLTFNISPTGSTGTLTFSTPPAINSTTGTLTYTATNGTNGTASFSVTLSDNGSNVPPNSNTSGAQAFTITVNAPNASPVVTTTVGNLAYTENAGAVAIDPGLTVTDSDNTDLTGATVAITAGFVSAQDTLAFTNQLGITGSYNSGTGVLTLTGTTTVANYQTALRSVTYQNGSDDPTASRTITFTATDGISTAGTATRGIAITAVNDGPVNTVPGPQTTNEDTVKVFSSGNSNQISVADVDAGAGTVQVALTATNGVLTLSTTAGLSFVFSDGNGTGTGDGTADVTMTFRGTLTAVNTALNGMSFTPATDFNGAATVQIVSNDLGNTGTGSPLTDSDTVNITVTSQNDAPVVTASGGSLAYTENDPATAIDSGLTVTDVDSPNLVGATVAITSGFVSADDTLAFTNQNGITGNYNSGTGVLTLTGTSSLANYQTALRSVTYANSSDNPTASRTVTFIADDGSSTSAPATKGITITAVNDAPVNTVPGPQGTNLNTPLTFSSGGGNQISVADVDAGASSILVQVQVTNGQLTLSGTSGLNFACAGCSGDGTADASMGFQGTIANINTALNGMTFTPTAAFSGTATLTIVTNDLGNTGTGGAKSDTDTVNITVGLNMNVQDASLPEPPSGTANMLFTVSLSSAAPGTVTVHYSTANGGGTPATAGACGGGGDYVAVPDTVLTFTAGQQIKTIPVTICADATGEPDETFLLNLSTASGATLVDAQATGTIKAANTAGALLISELRTSGPGGATDEFVEIYNNSDVAHVVPAGGYGLFKMGATCGDAPVLVGTIPATTTIPARGHFLFTGSGYTLANYGGTGAAAGNAPISPEIENDRNVALFATTNVANISTANRFDAVGFGTNTGNNCDFLLEGTTLPPVAGSVTEHSYFRKLCDFVAGVGCSTPGTPKDTNNNSTDFLFADTLATSTVAGQRLGAPGPENLGSPISRDANMKLFLLDAGVGVSSVPNRVRDLAAIDPNFAANGTLALRRRILNSTGSTVTRLRFRVVEITTAPPAVVGDADVRAITTATDVAGVTITNDTVTCGGPASCTVTVKKTTLETPPAQPKGGGWNSTLTVDIPGGMPNNTSLNIQLLLGVQQTGNFRYLVIVEALP